MRTSFHCRYELTRTKVHVIPCRSCCNRTTAESNVNATEGYLFSSLLSCWLVVSMWLLKTSKAPVLNEKDILATVFSSGWSVCHLSVCRVGTFKQARNCEGQGINLYHSEYKVTLSVSLWLSLQNNSETIVICVPYFVLRKPWGKHGETSGCLYRALMLWCTVRCNLLVSAHVLLFIFLFIFVYIYIFYLFI